MRFAADVVLSCDLSADFDVHERLQQFNEAEGALR
jgi:hypothetical protein